MLIWVVVTRFFKYICQIHRPEYFKRVNFTVCL